MNNTSLFRPLKRFGAPEISIIIFGVILCVLIFYLEYTTHSTKHGDLHSFSI